MKRKSYEGLSSCVYGGGKKLPKTVFFPFSTFTRDVFYVRREVDFLKTAKVNAYIMNIFGKIELLSIHAT